MKENKTEKFINSMELKIQVIKLEIEALDRSDKLSISLANQYLQGLETSLRTFKIINDR